MGDNKISEAAVEAARDAYHEADVEPMRAAIEAALNHLQDEAVPVACVPDDAAVDELRRFANSNIGSAHGITRKQAREVLVKFANFYLHPQPAELSEVSGISGELPPLPMCKDRQPDDMQGYMESALDWTRDPDNCDAVDWLIDNHRAIRAALAATGKQQVGEVQGDALAMIGSNLRSILDLASKMGGGAYQLTVANIQHEANHALQLLQAALASRQPVGAQDIDLGQFRERVAEVLRSEFDLEVADPEDYRHDDGSAEAERIAGKIAALINGRDAGTGVE